MISLFEILLMGFGGHRVLESGRQVSSSTDFGLDEAEMLQTLQVEDVPRHCCVSG